jgi:hypothetical protein
MGFEISKLCVACIGTMLALRIGVQLSYKLF